MIDQLDSLLHRLFRNTIAELTADARRAVAALSLPDDALSFVDAGPAPALIVDADSTSMVVLGSRGHGRVAGALTGSVSQHVATLERAIDLSPNLVEAHRSYALFLMRTGRMEEAMTQGMQALITGSKTPKAVMEAVEAASQKAGARKFKAG